MAKLLFSSHHRGYLGEAMAQVTLEVFSPLTNRLVGPGHRGKVVLHQEIAEGITLRQLLHNMAEGENRPLVTATYDLEQQTLTNQVLLVLNGQSLSRRQGLDTPLEEGDCITFLPPYAGGK